MDLFGLLRTILRGWIRRKSSDDRTPPVVAATPERADVRIGVITALAHERVAVRGVLRSDRQIAISGEGGSLTYDLARVSSRTGGEHSVAVGRLEGMGNRRPMFLAQRMARDFPRLKAIIMCGIGGAIPNPAKPEHHVRLGDVVVSDRKGMFSYDSGRDTDQGFEVSPEMFPASPRLLEAAHRLVERALEGDRPWVAWISDFVATRGTEWQRPASDTDKLRGSDDPEDVVPHPIEPGRPMPRIFHGAIASADHLQKNRTIRDQLRERFAAKAVDMEGVGVAEAARQLGIDYLVIRGTCDYCDSHKNDRWQNYAAVAAAAYCRALIEEIAADLRPLPNDALSLPPVPTPLPPAANELIGSVARQLAAELVATLPAQRKGPEDLDRRTFATDRVRALRREIDELLAVLEFEAAIAIGADLEAFLAQSESDLSPDVASEAYLLLARLALTGRPVPPAPESVARARRFVEKAKALGGSDG